MEEFQKKISRPLFTIIIRPKILLFATYSILTGQTKVDFVIYWVFSPYQLVEIPKLINCGRIFGWHVNFFQNFCSIWTNSLLVPFNIWGRMSFSLNQDYSYYICEHYYRPIMNLDHGIDQTTKQRILFSPFFSFNFFSVEQLKKKTSFLVCQLKKES